MTDNIQEKERINKVLKSWKQKVGMNTPVVWRMDNNRNKMCIWAEQSWLLIGLRGERYKEFLEKLKKENPDNPYVQNGIDIIEVNGGI